VDGVKNQINKCVAEVWPNGKNAATKKEMEPSNLHSSIVFGKAVSYSPCSLKQRSILLMAGRVTLF